MESIQITTVQAIAGVVFLVGTIGTLLKIIQKMYADTAFELRGRIAKLEAREELRDEDFARTVESLNRAVDLLDRNTGVTEQVVRTTAPARRVRGADD